MRRSAMGCSLMMTVCLAVGVFAQTAPNFSGTWTLVPDPAAPPAGGRGRGGGMLGTTVTIGQDEKTLTITRATGAGEIKSTYNLDGSSRTNTVTFGGNSTQFVSRAKWNGGKLVITTSSNFGGETTMSLSLDGGNLVVESTRPDVLGGRRGSTPAGDGASVTSKVTYKKG